MKTRNVPIAEVLVPPVRVTSYFDQDVYAQFQKTVAQVGVVEPIVVVEVDEKYYLVDGLHRLVEAQERGDQEIAAVVVPGEEKDVLLANLFLNVLRGRTKVADMRAVVDSLHTQFKIGVKEICEKTGLTPEFVNDYLAVSRLPADVLEAFDDGRLAKGKALALARLPTPELQLRVFYQIDGRNLSVEDVEEIVAVVLEEQGKAPAPPAKPKTSSSKLGMPCVLCKKDTPLDQIEGWALCPDCRRRIKELK